MSEPNVFTHPRVIEHDAEQCECAQIWLDDQNVPRKDGDGKPYSLVGRIRRLLEKKS